MVNELPAQMLPLLTVTVGKLFTDTLLITVFDAGQPCELLPVTV
jgi:hypothetical protein